MEKVSDLQWVLEMMMKWVMDLEMETVKGTG
jgi:hypothetical protein